MNAEDKTGDIGQRTEQGEQPRSSFLVPRSFPNVIRPFLPVLCSLFLGSLLLFFIEPHVVEGPSMEPTLGSGDRMLVETLTPRLGILFRGQLIVFRDPRDPKHPVVVKRIVGLPGETVVVQRDSVTIRHGDGREETFEKGSVLGRKDNGDDKTMLLGPCDYFLMGDNRADSRDSRDWGTIQPSEMLGRPVLRYSPQNRAVSL